MMEQIIARFPGVSCAWVDAAGRVTTECWGVADKERKLPVDGDTIFPACSISKFVTAICVMKLQERQAIDIDAPVNKYLHRWKLRNPEGSESTATIRALLCQTAGVMDGEDAFYGLRPASAAMITAAGVTVARASFFTIVPEYSAPQLDWRCVALAALLLLLTRVVKKTKKFHPIVFIAFSAVVGVVFRFAGA